MADKILSDFSPPNMTNEWIEWTGENRMRTSNYRGSSCSNYLNNNHHNYKCNATPAANTGTKPYQTNTKLLNKQKG